MTAAFDANPQTRSDRRRLGRRHLLAAALATPLLGTARAQPIAHAPFGRVQPPRPAPAVTVTLHDGRVRTLPGLLTGQLTAMQLMFTGCSATCPLQGALFAQIASRLDATGPQLLSLSIDPLSDTPAALTQWLARHGGRAPWLAGAPAVSGVDAVLDAIQGRARSADNHTAQVYVFDAHARLMYRTAAFPSPTQVLDALYAVAGTAGPRGAWQRPSPP